MRQFEMRMLPWNVVFGAGSLASLPARLDELGLRRVLVLTTPQQAADGERVAALIGERAAGVFTEARMHVPAETAAAAAARARELGCDASVSIGGGSTTGLGKALALDPGLPLVAIPTTYAGSEMTNIWGMTEDGAKRTGRDLRVLPKLTLYDAELTVDLPPRIAGPSGMNAMAQAVINAKDPRANPVIVSLALEAIGAIAAGLPVVMREPADIEAREQVLYGAALGGASLGAGVTSLHHRLCHTLGGSYDTPHAETHTILLPYSVAYAAPAVPERMARIAAALGTSDAARGLFDLSTALGLPTSLADIGIRETDLPRIAELATATPVENPRPVTPDGVLKLLERAHAGALP
ncbi:MAG: maleylacetate reductase [Gammaproteobacteria bacterium]